MFVYEERHNAVILIIMSSGRRGFDRYVDSIAAKNEEKTMKNIG